MATSARMGWGKLGLSLVVLLGVNVAVPAQSFSAAEPATLFESNVSFIDSALPGSQWRLRYDSGYNSPFPSRGEFFYPRPGPNGPGPRYTDQHVDAQEFSSYQEFAVSRQFSGFFQVPYRLLNPDRNMNTYGFGDLNAGLKYALVDTADFITTLQFRTYIPTGQGDRGTGTHHVSVEPAVLTYARLTEDLTAESELRYWVPVGGTENWAGEHIRYGLSLSYNLFAMDGLAIVPVAECVGWTFLSGQKADPSSPLLPVGLNARGDTIVNMNLGVRWKWEDFADIYTGYGHRLTGDSFFQDMFRVEFRLLF